jgi:hypothetical protein
MNTFNNATKSKEVQCERVNMQVSRRVHSRCWSCHRSIVSLFKSREVHASTADMYDCQRLPGEHCRVDQSMHIVVVFVCLR